MNPVAQSGSMVSAGVIQALAGTKPWVRFCSIIGFIMTGLIFMGAAFMGLGGGLMTAAMNDSGASLPFAGFTAAIAIIYVLMGLLYLFPSIKLWKYGSHINLLMASNSMNDLESALDAQRGFWKLVGIMVSIFIGLYLIGIAGFVVIAVIGASSGSMVSP